MSTRITTSFGGQNRNFELRIGEIIELERLCRAGIGEITARLLDGRHMVSDIRETIRLGLEGAGTSPVEAHALVSRYVEGQPLMDNLALAQAITTALHRGAEAINAALAAFAKPGQAEPDTLGEQVKPGEAWAGQGGAVPPNPAMAPSGTNSASPSA